MVAGVGPTLFTQHIYSIDYSSGILRSSHSTYARSVNHGLVHGETAVGDRVTFAVRYDKYG